MKQRTLVHLPQTHPKSLLNSNEYMALDLHRSRRRRSALLRCRTQWWFFPFRPANGPIERLSFIESRDPVRFAEAAEEEPIAHARVHLRDLKL